MLLEEFCLYNTQGKVFLMFVFNILSMLNSFFFFNNYKYVLNYIILLKY